MCLNHGPQHARRERFWEEIVHARGETRSAVFWKHVGGARDDAEAAAKAYNSVFLSQSDSSRNLQPVHLWHLKVQEDQRIGTLANRRKRLAAALRHIGRVAQSP